MLFFLVVDPGGCHGVFHRFQGISRVDLFAFVLFFHPGTGNDQINVRLRKGRVATVKNELVNRGVAEGRLETQINNGELTDYGPKCASLDRAVTIHRK